MADLEGRILHHLGYDFADDDPDPDDMHGHGTHVTGTIAAALNNSTSVAGVAPEVCVFAVKVLSDDGDGTSEDVAAGIVHAADQGAKVINLSLGCDCDPQLVIEDALGYAANKGVVIVAAAGNDSQNHLSYPASSSLTISVGALEPDLSLASFSNRGAGLDLVAPGVDVVSLFEDGESCQGSGTSMASPHVAGVAALVRSIAPNLSRNEVRTLLRQTARDLGSSGYDTTYGHGIVDAQAAVVAAGGNLQACKPSAKNLCLGDGRFRVEADWRRPDGSTGRGTAIPLTADTGYFWFFNAKNLEVIVKVLDACTAGSGRFWVFAGGLTNVEVNLRVTDTATGAVREYTNPLRKPFQPIQDTNAFATCGAGKTSGKLDSARYFDEVLFARPVSGAGALLAAAPEILASSEGTVVDGSLMRQGTCVATSTALCLGNDRFKVEARWHRPDGSRGQGRVHRLTADTGYFWFFQPTNVEMVVKVLDACGINPQRFWVFAGGLTNVEVDMVVTDTVTGAVKSYNNPLRTPFQPILDTGAFATCP